MGGSSVGSTAGDGSRKAAGARTLVLVPAAPEGAWTESQAGSGMKHNSSILPRSALDFLSPALTAVPLVQFGF